MASTDAITKAIQASGLDSKTLNYIKQKAETGVAMDTPTAQKQSVYDAYQQYYTNQVQQKAAQGIPLDSPNEWKNSIYQASQQPAALTVDQYMAQVQDNSASKVASLQQYLQNSAQAQIGSQTAQLGFARDQALADIEKSIQTAVANGEMSIRQAQQQFEAAKGQIDQQHYADSEITNLVAHDRGIQNSAQMIGLMQGDNARRNSLVSQQMTQRDQTINEINMQLNNLKYDAEVNRGLANSQYNYGLASAQGDIYANMYNQMYQTDYDMWNTQQSQQFDLFNSQLQQQYALEQMAKQQDYNVANMNAQNAFDLNKLSIQQQYQLEQMARNFGYDLSKMSVDQQNTLAQMAQAFGYDMSLQSSSQGFQASQNALDRNTQVQLQQMRQNHDLNMLSAEQQAQLGQYELELGRKLAQYQEGTMENQLLKAEFNWAVESMQVESAAQIAADLGATQLANLLESYPKALPDTSDKKAVDAYNAQVEALNAQVTKLMGTQASKYTMDKLQASNRSTEEKNSFLQFLKKGLSIIGNYQNLP